MIIKESFLIAATTADILAAPSRLSAIPHNGTFVLEMSAHSSDATNFSTVTLQTPDGNIPFEDLVIPANGYASGDDVLNSQSQLTFSMPASQGGHFLLSIVDNGANVVIIHATLHF